jgi:uncharacterized protein
MKSPCINICRMDPARQVCMGCCRTLDEIASWSSLPEAERERVMQSLDERRRQLGVPTLSSTPCAP